LNDLTILSLSPLLDRLLDVTFEEVEEIAGVVPFEINGHQFNATWITVDGIYPPYSRFVRGIKETEKRYTKWQEATRKDIERAYGFYRTWGQFLARPILLMDLEQISLTVTTCIILHNMLLSDRVMGQCGVVYNPSHVLQEVEDDVNMVQQPEDLPTILAGIVQKPEDLTTVQAGDFESAQAGVSGIGIGTAPRQVIDVVARSQHVVKYNTSRHFEGNLLQIHEKNGSSQKLPRVL
jgi:Plant transposon protein